jgi:hypothetical protein
MYHHVYNRNNERDRYDNRFKMCTWCGNILLVDLPSLVFRWIINIGRGLKIHWNFWSCLNPKLLAWMYIYIYIYIYIYVTYIKEKWKNRMECTGESGKIESIKCFAINKNKKSYWTKYLLTQSRGVVYRSLSYTRTVHVCDKRIFCRANNMIICTRKINCSPLTVIVR